MNLRPAIKTKKTQHLPSTGLQEDNIKALTIFIMLFQEGKVGKDGILKASDVREMLLRDKIQIYRALSVTAIAEACLLHA